MKTRRITFLPLIALLFSLAGCEKGTKVTFFSNGSDDKNVTEETNTIDGSNEQDGNYLTDGNTDNTNGNEYIVPTGVFNLKVKGESNLLQGNIKAGVYPPGFEFKFSIQPVSDAEFYPYLNNERIKADYYENSKWVYSFKMPAEDCELVIAGRFYVDRDYTLDEIFMYGLTRDEDSIKSVIIKKGTIGTSTNNEIVIESTDKRDISYNYHFVLEEPFRKMDTWEASGGGTYTQLIFVTEASRFTFEIKNGVVRDPDFTALNLFEYANENHNEPKIEYPDDLGAWK